MWGFYGISNVLISIAISVFFVHAFTLTQGLKHEWQLGPEAKDNLLSSYAAEATANEIFVFKKPFFNGKTVWLDPISHLFYSSLFTFSLRRTVHYLHLIGLEF